MTASWPSQLARWRAQVLPPPGGVLDQEFGIAGPQDGVLSDGERRRECVGVGHRSIGLDARRIEHDPFVREAGVDGVAKIAHGLDGLVLAMQAAKDVVDLAQVDPYVVDAPDLDTVIELCRVLPAYDIDIRPVLGAH